MNQHRLFVLLVILFLIGCSSPNENRLFQSLDAEKTGVYFNNTITTNDSINVINFQYCYNGGGVGIGDFNKDGLPDIYFTGNQVSSKMYINKGDFKFIDVTEVAKVTTNSWATGVSIVDINSDGLDDIYVNVGGADCKTNCPNLLFVNQGTNKEGIPVFKELASDYGLNESEYAQQTAFFDFDLDGDLDAFIVRNGNVRFDKNAPMPKRYFPDYLTDVLLENVWSEEKGHPIFKDVSAKYAINGKGFGLGLGVNDFNNDGYPDILVGNDFITSDLLYINKTKDSLGFSEETNQYFAHSTYNAMGLDIADVNNDALPDVMVLDMFPMSYKRQKKMLGAMNYDKYQLGLKNGYQSQYMRNTLSLNDGFVNNKALKFSEVSFLTNTAKTDWSWSPLMVDFDLDGDKDMFITNGYGKDITDLDFINYTKQNNIFGTAEAREAKLKELVKELPSIKLKNFFYENQNKLQFNDVSSTWSNQIKTLSNGAAYADLDQDGDLDLVINNINQEATILRNLASDKEATHYLNITLKGTEQNKKGIGAKVILWDNGSVQTHYQSVVRGYLSSMQPGAYFGLQDTTIDSIQVKWPSGKVSSLKNITSNQRILIEADSAKPILSTGKVSKYLVDKTSSVLSFKHEENSSNDYTYQSLLLTQHSKNGPCITSTISLGESLLFVGGSKGNAGTIMKQVDHIFKPIQELDREFEDVDAVFIDIDQDNDMDLYVASGGNEFGVNSKEYQDRLYINNGKNEFRLSTNRLPSFLSNTSCVVANDYDKDGDTDIFVGNSFVPRSYPVSTKSMLLTNQDGVLSEKISLEDLGIVKGAIWKDIDNDGWDDLFIVGDWMPLTIYKNHQGNLKKVSASFTDNFNENLSTQGWWNEIASGDFDNDGDIDFVIGNQGLNNVVNATQEYPLYIYKKDFDNNGSVDPVIGAYFDVEDGDKELKVLHTRDDVMKQLSMLKDRYTSYEDFSTVNFKELLNINNLKDETLKVNLFESVLIENLGDFKFKVRVLPIECQMAPVNAILVDDIDKDGKLDVLLSGNDSYTETHYGGQDALNGILLKGDGKMGFRAIRSSKSGFYVPGQSNDIEKITMNTGDELIFVAQNNDSIAVFTKNNN